MWAIRTSTEKNGALSDISREILYVTIVLCLNILWLKAVNEIAARQTRTSFRKYDVINVCNMEYLTAQIELVLPTFKSWIVHKTIAYLTLGLLSSLWNIYHSTTVYFLTHPVGLGCVKKQERISGANRLPAISGSCTWNYINNAISVTTGPLPVSCLFAVRRLLFTVNKTTLATTG